jgi:hypothetical protein
MGAADISICPETEQHQRVCACFQQVSAGEVSVDASTRSASPPPPYLTSLEFTAPPAEVDEAELLEKQIAKTKKVADLQKQLAEAQALLEEAQAPPPRSNWNLLSRN